MLAVRDLLWQVDLVRPITSASESSFVGLVGYRVLRWAGSLLVDALCALYPTYAFGLASFPTSCCGAVPGGQHRGGVGWSYSPWARSINR